MNVDTSAPPDALLLMGKHCPYCPTVLKHLQTLQAEGSIGQLETVVIEEHPERAAELGVRSVPWVRIGTFELTGLRSESELRDWAQKAASGAGQSQYLAELLESGGIVRCIELVSKDEAMMRALLYLFTDPDGKLNVRIGISAVMESLAGTPNLQAIAADLHELLSHPEARVRGDACHYLSMSGHPQAAAWIKPLLEDTDAHVREIAEESLIEISGAPSPSGSWPN